MSKKKYLVTGGYGFIGSALIKKLINHSDNKVLNIDKLTYAATTDSLKNFEKNKNYFFLKQDISNFKTLKKVFIDYKPNIVIHLAAETHVDRSIYNPKKFINSNIIGTFNLLEISKLFYNTLSKKEKNNFLFLYISTDEVFGDNEKKNKPANENNSYNPSSPYSATKASSNHLVNVWNKTYNLPTIITNSTNNYGPYQFPEKFIPSVIIRATCGKKIKIYGDGHQSRDWIYVDDHVNALLDVTKDGVIGETYNIGSKYQIENIKLAKLICNILDKLVIKKPKGVIKFQELITFVHDRPAHDRKYNLNVEKIKSQLFWEPLETFDTGIFKTIKWYLNNKDWWMKIKKTKKFKF